MILKKISLLTIPILCMLIIARGEHDWGTLPFIAFIFSTLFAIILLCTRRLAFSILVSSALLISLTAISMIKLLNLKFSLMAFDVYFYLRNIEVLNFLSHYFLLSTVLCALTLTLGLIISYILFRKESAINFPRNKITLFLLISLCGIYLTYPLSATGDGNVSYCFSRHCTSCFFTSLPDLTYVFRKTHLESKLENIQLTATYQAKINKVDNQANPDIIVILMESAVPPSIYPEIKIPKSFEDSFRSSDGKLYPLRTETYAGATWISTTGLMTSIPTSEFGWMKTYLPVTLERRIHHSLPQFLKSQGYATATLSPLAYQFVNEGPFLTSLGIDTYLDIKTIKAPTTHERDAFYFDAALNYIKEHHRTDKRPLFLFLMTMATHGPYDFRFDPTTKIAGEPFGNNSNTDEYLRRLAMQRNDFEKFKTELKKNTTKHGAIVLDFGDHQPAVTECYPEFKSKLYLTSYNITPINTKLAVPIPQFATLDIGFLAPTLLTSAGLPIDDVYEELIALRDQCHGDFTNCKDQDRIMIHLKKLVNSKLLEFPH